MTVIDLENNGAVTAAIAKYSYPINFASDTDIASAKDKVDSRAVLGVSDANGVQGYADDDGSDDDSVVQGYADTEGVLCASNRCITLYFFIVWV